MEATVPTASGSRPQLILTVTRRCDLRCAYCPTVKDGEPDLTPDDARRAVALFVARFGGGDMKVFGGEPMLVPEVTRAAVRAAPAGIRVHLSTNGRNLDDDTLDLVAQHPRATLTLSLDGAAGDHDGLRRGAPSHARALALLPRLLRLPRFVVTQTIAPSTAPRAAENFRFLLALGIRRFNLLPAYFVPWSAPQLAALHGSFSEIAGVFRAAWSRGDRLYLRNLFVRAPTPFFNTGMVVDSDRTIHPSNLVLAHGFGDLRARTRLGTLDDPPDRRTLDDAARGLPALLAGHVPPVVWASTLAVDRELTSLCNSLYPAYFARRAAA
jgi:MoaA/NifB/PqqE/SkfB family radical SAM enzyme